MNKDLYINKTFQEDFELLDIENDIKFDNCIFKGNFNFNECVLNNIHLINFYNCIFEGNFQFIDRKGEYAIDYLNFYKCNFNGFVNIEETKINNLQIFSTGNLNKNDKNFFNGITTFRNIKYNSISIIGAEINNRFSFYGCKKILKKAKISFNQTIGKGLIYINYTNEINDLSFTNIKNFNNIKIQVNKINKFEFLDIHNLKEFSIGGIEKKENIKYISLGRIFNKEEKGFFDFYNIEIDYIEFFQSPQIPDDFTFSDIIFKEANFSNINLGKTIFNGVEIKKLYLENTTLNDCIFNGVDFPDDYRLEDIKLKEKIIEKYSEVKKIGFLKKILNFLIEVFGIIFPDLEKLLFKDKKNEKIFETEIDYKKMKDNYRQLKFVMEKNGNKTESNKFFEKEMEYYFKEINSKKIFKSIKDYFNFSKYLDNGILIGEKITLIIGKLLSNFGNNWVLTLIWLFGFVYFSTYIKAIWDYYTKEEIIENYNNIISGASIYNSIFVKIIYFIFFIFLIYFFIKLFIKVFNFLFKKAPIFLLIGVFVGIYFLYGDKEIFNNFLKLLFNPLYGFKELYSEEMKGLELLGFTTYKIIYLIIFWHLIVALKRTTKR